MNTTKYQWISWTCRRDHVLYSEHLSLHHRTVIHKYIRTVLIISSVLMHKKGIKQTNKWNNVPKTSTKKTSNVFCFCFISSLFHKLFLRAQKKHTKTKKQATDCSRVVALHLVFGLSRWPIDHNVWSSLKSWSTAAATQQIHSNVLSYRLRQFNKQQNNISMPLSLVLPHEHFCMTLPIIFWWEKNLYENRVIFRFVFFFVVGVVVCVKLQLLIALSW